MAELKAATDIIGYDEVGAARLPGLGHARVRGQHPPGLLRPGPARRGGGAPGGGHPAGAPPGRHHLPRRPVRVPASRPPAGPRDLRRWPSTPPATRTASRRPDPRSPPPSSTTRCGPAERFRQIHEKFLELGLESPFDDKWLARMTRDRAVHHDHRRHRLHRRAGRGAARRTPPRSTRTRRSGSGCRPRSCATSTPSTSSAWPQSRVGPTDVTEDDLFAGVRPPRDT